MKKYPLFVVFALAVFTLGAQSLPKKYVLLEHFTNSRCSVCASRNPAFYTLIHQYPNEVRHISYHPAIPYNDCKIYLANTTQNNARTAAYGVFGTPRVALNGNLVPIGNPLLPAATLQAAFGQQSPIAIEVEESGTAPNKTAIVTVRSFGDTPAGNYKLFVAVAERTVNYASPNGEQKHYDVFRSMLTSIDGDAITLPVKGQSDNYTFSYTHTQPNGWPSNYDSLYVLAFVQNTSTQEVLNSGTRFDPVFTDTDEAGEAQPVRIQPNPASEEATVLMPGEQVARVEVFSISGGLVFSDNQEQADRVRLPVSALEPGIYVVRIVGKNGLYSGKFVKARG
ncbi:MAG: Omp28-related outer membrane protein [Saprospiraceae bacterium]